MKGTAARCEAEWLVAFKEFLFFTRKLSIERETEFLSGLKDGVVLRGKKKKVISTFFRGQSDIYVLDTSYLYPKYLSGFRLNGHLNLNPEVYSIPHSLCFGGRENKIYSVLHSYIVQVQVHSTCPVHVYLVSI